MPTFDTDKITVHGYYPVYQKLAEDLGPEADVLELGVLEGESLKMWKYLFPKGKVTGVDYSVHAVWPEGTRKVVCDQCSPNLPGLLDDEFDIIVDDASHEGYPTKESFRLLWPLLRTGGYYVVEDWGVGLCGVEGSPYNGQGWGDSMLKTAESFLPLLVTSHEECDYITYMYNMIIIHKRA